MSFVRWSATKAVWVCLALCLLGADRVPLFAADVKVLFLGDNGHHRPESRFQELAKALEPRGVALKYTDRMEDLTPATLNQFDGLVLYANIDRIEPAQAQTVLDYVASGKGFIPLHCATYCWRNSPEMVKLMGGQFLRHGGQVFSTVIAEPQHPLMQNFHGFTSWDETYIHHLHNPEQRTVLEYRVEGEQAEGQDREPWTWVRTHGKGRVFYTAWGHDQRTFTNPGFHNLVERGIRWACGKDPAAVPAFSDPNTFSPPAMTSIAKDVKPFEYVEVGPKIPNYTPGNRWGVQGVPKTTMQLPLSPEESLKHFVTPQGMAVRLYADERNFQAKPIALAWDERGRLWLCETVDYPNELGKNRDRIRICEDTDGDGRADKFTIFAEGMSIPTAMVMYRGGVIVQNGTETIYLKDTNGDDRADLKTTLISGWALGDTHGGVSNFRYGLDNWIWAMQGYNNSSPEYDGKHSQSFRMGFWRFKLSNTDPPKVTDLEFIRSSNNNTWGLGISEEGLIFGSTANRNPSMFVPIPNRYYEQVRGWAPATLGSIADTFLFKAITENVRQVDQFGGYTAGAGHALYTARTFPPQWWNKTAFVCEPTGHLVGTFVLRRQGADYQSTSPINLLASDDEWAAPIMAEVGPDGAVWVLDWYNYIVQHNPTPQGFETGKGNAYESDLRDKKHGRVVRVVPTESRDQGRQSDIVHSFRSLAGAGNAQLLEALRHPSFMWRLTAQRLLIEKNVQQPDAVVPGLLALIKDKTTDQLGLNVGAIHALQTLHGLGVLNSGAAIEKQLPLLKAIDAALSHTTPGVRRNALTVLPHDAEARSIFLRHGDLCDDPDPQVRLQALLTLADLPPELPEIPRSGTRAPSDLVIFALRTANDPVLVDALTAAASVHATARLSDLSSAQQPSPAGLAIARRVAEHIARGKPNAAALTAVVQDLRKADPVLQNAILEGLTAGLPANFELAASADFDKALVAALAQADPAGKSKLVRLAAQCRTKALDAHAEQIVQSLIAVVSNPAAADAERRSAAKDLLGFRPEDANVAAAIVKQLNAQIAPELGTAFLQALAGSRAAATGTQLVDAIPTLTPQLKTVAISSVLTRPDWVKALLNGLESHTLDLTDLSLDQKQALRTYPDKEIQQQADRLLAMSGGLPDANRDKVLKSLLHIAEHEGSVEAGLEMFKKHCAKCHMHGEVGKNIGPNLTGMSVHPKEELLTHIIDPSRSVEGNFRIYQVVLNSGRVLNGMLAAETRTSITLVDAEAKESVIQREDIEDLVASKKSLMPEGFEKQMTEAELTNLLEFLANKGKFVPIPLDRYATAISTKGLFHDGDDGPDRLVFEDWKPKLVKGTPFLLTDPRGKSKPNIVLLNGPRGTMPPQMPKSVVLPCNTNAKVIHVLGGIGGWSFPAETAKSASMIIRLHYADGSKEDHELINGVHLADYIRRVDVPESEFAFQLGGQQVRYLTVRPQRNDKINTIELVKGNDPTAPIVMAITVERPTGTP